MGGSSRPVSVPLRMGTSRSERGHGLMVSVSADLIRRNGSHLSQTGAFVQR